LLRIWIDYGDNRRQICMNKSLVEYILVSGRQP